jgi:hypothetical protein
MLTLVVAWLVLNQILQRVPRVIFHRSRDDRNASAHATARW